MAIKLDGDSLIFDCVTISGDAFFHAQPVELFEHFDSVGHREQP